MVPMDLDDDESGDDAIETSEEDAGQAMASAAPVNRSTSVSSTLSSSESEFDDLPAAPIVVAAPVELAATIVAAAPVEVSVPVAVAAKPAAKPMTEVVIETVDVPNAPEAVIATAQSAELAAYDLTDAVAATTPAAESHVEMAPETQARITELAAPANENIQADSEQA
jgi:hypothetical protein